MNLRVFMLCLCTGYYIFAEIDPSVGLPQSLFRWHYCFHSVVVFLKFPTIICQLFHCNDYCQVSAEREREMMGVGGGLDGGRGNKEGSILRTTVYHLTCSHPDLMMEAYFKQIASPLFFVLYMILTVYCINSVVRIST